MSREARPVSLAEGVYWVGKSESGSNPPCHYVLGGAWVTVCGRTADASNRWASAWFAIPAEDRCKSCDAKIGERGKRRHGKLTPADIAVLNVPLSPLTIVSLLARGRWMALRRGIADRRRRVVPGLARTREGLRLAAPSLGGDALEDRRFADLSEVEAQAICDRFIADHPRRVRDFIAEVRRRGGPAEALNGSRASLVPLWSWFVENHRLPDDPATDAQIRKAGAPWWFEFRHDWARRLGPGLAGFATGLASYVDHVVIGEADAWAKEHGTGMLLSPRWRPGGGPAGQYFRMPLLQHVGSSDAPSQWWSIALSLDALGPLRRGTDPNRLDALAGAISGDLAPYRRASEMTGTEARALLNEVREAHPAAVQACAEEVRRRGGPADALDFSRASLENVWTWFVSLPLPDYPASHEELDAADPPWWYLFHPQVARGLGVDLTHLVTLITSYWVECILRHVPGAKWKVGSEKRPVLTNPWHGDHDLAAVGLSLLGYMQGKRHWDGPGRLAGSLEPRPAQPIVEAEPEPAPWEVAPIDKTGSQFGFGIQFDDNVAHEEEDRVEALITWLQAHPSIDEAIHEDREFALVRARTLTTADLQAIVAEGWGADPRLVDPR